MTTTTATPAFSAVWSARVRAVLAVALLWAGLHFLASPLLPRGLDRPLVLAASPYGPLAGLAVIGIVWSGAAIVAMLLGPQPRWQPLALVGLALALWTAEGGRAGGTMGHWLILRNEVPGPPRGGPYWLLLVDYAYLSVAVAGGHVCAARVAARQGGQPLLAGLRQARGAGGRAAPVREGLLALTATTVGAAVTIVLLMGPALSATLRGQVYFAVAIGFFAGVFVARRLVSLRDVVWFWPAPLVVGVLGLVGAGLWPGMMLPQGCELDTVPAWALARPLPIEMVGVGLVGGLWRLRPRAPDGSPADSA